MGVKAHRPVTPAEIARRTELFPFGRRLDKIAGKG